MITPDHDAADRLDVYFDQLAHGDDQSPAELPPWLAATARALRDQHEAPAPDPRFVARLRETLLMDASIPLPGLSLAPNPTRNGTAPSRATSLPPLPLSAPDQRHRDARRHLASSATPAPVPTAIGPRRPRRGPAQRWNRLGWPIVELIGAAALIVGLVSILMGGSGGGGLPALVPGFGNVQEATPTVAPVAGEVAMAQGNAGRTGEMPGPGVTSDPTLQWRVDLGYPTTAISPQVVVAGGIVYAAVTNAGPSGSDQSLVTGLRAIDAADGSLRWDVTTNAQAISAPVVAQGLVIVGIGTVGQPLDLDGSVAPASEGDSTAGYLVAFDAMSGAERWRLKTGGIDSRDLTVADGKLFVADQAGRVQALDVTTGATVWSTFIPPIGGSQDQRPMFSSVSVAWGTAIVQSTFGDLYAYDSGTGAFKWTGPVTDGTSYFPFQNGDGPVIAADTVLVPAFDGSNGPDGMLKAFSLADGKALWSVSTGLAAFAGLAVDDESIYVAGTGVSGGGGHLAALDLTTGETRWAFGTQRPLTTAPIVVDGTIYVGGRDWQLFAFTTADSGLRWSVAPLGEIAGSAYVADGTVYFTASDGYLYAVGGDQSAAELLDREDPVDVSGATSCQAPPRVQRLDGDATPQPAHNPVPALALPNPDRPFEPPAIGLAELPVTGSASPDAIAGIQSTMDGLRTCSRPDDYLKRDGYYAPTFFQRTGLSSASELVGELDRPGALDGRPVVADVSNTMNLADGRTALIVMYPPLGERSGYGTLYIFTVIGGIWSIDEQVLITPSGHLERG